MSFDVRHTWNSHHFGIYSWLKLKFVLLLLLLIIQKKIMQKIFRHVLALKGGLEGKNARKVESRGKSRIRCIFLLKDYAGIFKYE